MAIKSHQNYGKVVKWSKLLTVTGGAQILVQLTGALTGIMLVRLLPVKELAYYTILNTMLGTMTILADGGIATGVMAEGGKVWQDRFKLGEVLSTGISLRKFFAVLSLIITCPILYYLLDKQGAQWWQIGLMIAALIPAFFSALSDSILEIVPKLHQDLKPLQKNQLVVSVGRFVLSVAGVFALPFTAIALLGNGLPRIYGNIQLRKITNNFVDLNAGVNPKVKASILSIVKRRMPEAIYYSFSGQITVWFLTVFGNVASVAQIGALSRISIITTFFTIVFGMIVVPRFARLQAGRSILYLKYVQAIALSLISLAALNFCVFIFSGTILSLLGSSYSTLNNELFLYFVGASIGILANFTYTMFSARGWLMNPLYSISFNALSLAGCAYFINVSTLQGAIWFGIANSSIQLFVNTVFLLYSIYKKGK